MRIHADSIAAFPRPRVYAAYRDELPALVPYLSNVKSIEVASRSETPGHVRLVNVWTARGEIPKAAQKALSPDMLRWKDHAEWDDAAWRCAWRIEPFVYADALACRGVTEFEEVPGGTRVLIRGELTLDLARVKGIPAFLAGTVRPLVERIFVAAIEPNLAGVVKGLEQFLARR